MTANTRQLLLESAAFLLRSKGFAAFSYGDLGNIVGIRKASIHHYFPKKEDLGMEVIASHIEKTLLELSYIEQENKSAFSRLEAFAELFSKAVQDNMLPLCGALAAEMAALPESMQQQTQRYFTIQLEWLEKVIALGESAGEFASHGTSEQKAIELLSLFEGGSLISWVKKDETRITSEAIKKVVGLQY